MSGIGSPAAFHFENVEPEWTNYLRLDRLEILPTLSAQESEEASRDAARDTLSRIYSPILTAEQRQLAYQIVGEDVEDQLRDLAVQPMDLPKLLSDLELHELHNNAYTRKRLNNHFQNGIWSGEKIPYEVAGTINAHYRNANVRISVTEGLINRIIPEMPAIQEPVKDRILGADVFGRSQISNRLHVQLTPDLHRWNLQLHSAGLVRSRTQAHRDGFVFHSVGSAQIFGAQRITISANGMAGSDINVEANADQRVVGMSSRYDRIPLIGRAARRIAQIYQQKQSAKTKCQVQRKIKRQVRSRFEKEVNEQVANLQSTFFDQFVGPMTALDLEPQPIEMKTTDDRLIARYRLAGFTQMGADSTRPRALASGLMSLQLHDSAINNFLARIRLEGKRFYAGNAG